MYFFPQESSNSTKTICTDLYGLAGKELIYLYLLYFGCHNADINLFKLMKREYKMLSACSGFNLSPKVDFSPGKRIWTVNGPIS